MRCLIVLLGCLLLGGCALAPPRLPAPVPAPLPATWLAKPDDAPAPATGADTVPWWQALADPALQDWIDAAAANPELAALDARLAMAAANRDGAAAARRPRMDGTLDAGREREAGLRPGNAAGAALPMPQRNAGRYGLRVDVAHELDPWGRLGLAEASASAFATASEQTLAARRKELRADVVRAALALRHTEADSAAADAATALLEQLARHAARRVEAGIAPLGELRDAERAIAAQRAETAGLRQRRQAQIGQLAALLGVAPTDLVVHPHPDWLAREVAVATIEPGLPVAVIAARADVSAAWERVLALDHAAEATRRAALPSLQITASTGMASGVLQQWLRGDALSWLAQAVLQGPLLDGGRQAARTAEAAAAVQEAHADYRRVVVLALAEVDAALSGVQTAQRRKALAEDALAQQRRDLGAATAARRAGLLGTPELLRQTLALHAAEREVLSERHAHLDAWVEAQRALGR